jgi:hypothetical protein
MLFLAVILFDTSVCMMLLADQTNQYKSNTLYLQLCCACVSAESLAILSEVFLYFSAVPYFLDHKTRRFQMANLGNRYFTYVLSSNSQKLIAVEYESSTGFRIP